MFFHPFDIDSRRIDVMGALYAMQFGRETKNGRNHNCALKHHDTDLLFGVSDWSHNVFARSKP